MIKIANKVIPENLVVVHQLREIHPNKPTIKEHTALLDGRFIGRFIEVKFSKLKHNNQIFRYTRGNKNLSEKTIRYIIFHLDGK